MPDEYTPAERFAAESSAASYGSLGWRLGEVVRQIRIAQGLLDEAARGDLEMASAVIRAHGHLGEATRHALTVLHGPESHGEGPTRA